MGECVSAAIETSCRRGGVALGIGEELVEAATFPADRRHAVQLVARLDELLARHRLSAGDLDEVYVSIGPGSFTGLRVGVTVARTLAQAGGVRCVGVPTAEAVAENAADLPGEHLAVVMDAKEGSVYAAVFGRRAGRWTPAGPTRALPAGRLAAEVPKPITLIGEGLWHHRLVGEGLRVADESLWLPLAEGVWAVGRRLARARRFEDFHPLRPLYLRRPEAVRLWEKRHPGERKSGPAG